MHIQTIGMHFPSMLRSLPEAGRFQGISTGYYELDNIISGLQRSQLYVIAGLSRMGHHEFGLNIAEWVAFECRLPVHVVTLGSPAGPILQQMILSRARVHQTQLSVRIDRDRVDDFFATVDEVRTSKRLSFDERPYQSIEALKSELVRKLTDSDYRVVLIHQAHSMLKSAWTNQRDSGDYERTQATFSSGLKAIAKLTNVPLLISMDLPHRRRSSRIPNLESLSVYGYLENDADVVMFVHRDEVMDPTTGMHGLTDLVVAKDRFGPGGYSRLAYIREHKRFFNLALSPVSV